MGKILPICCFIFVLVTLAESRGNILQGSTNGVGAHLIYHEVLEKHAIPFIKRDEEIKVTTINNELIRGISVQDLNGDSESYIKRGGLGLNNVTIRLKSRRGHGYKFIVDVYAS